MPGSPNGSDAHTNIFLYSHPRTRSNLLIRLLETHPQVMSKQYPFLFCFQKGPESQWTEETKIGIFEASGETLEEAEKKYAHLTFQAGLDDMERLLAEAQMKGKFCVIKEHTAFTFESKFLNTYVNLPRKTTVRPAMIDHKLDVIGPEIDLDLPSPPFPNPTLLPDRIVATVSPVVIIRHPIFTYPSWVRASSVFGGNVFDAEFSLVGSYRWQRIIYDFYREYYDKTDPEGKKDWPIVMDGDKLVEDTQGQMKKFCELVGLTESEIQYSWDSAGRPPDRLLTAFMGTISESTGVIKGPDSLRIPDLDEEVKKWTAEWNEEVAQKVKEAVNSSLEDYEYLRARCL